MPQRREFGSVQSEGPAIIAGVDNGSPISLERFKADHRKAFYGNVSLCSKTTGKEER